MKWTELVNWVVPLKKPQVARAMRAAATLYLGFETLGLVAWMISAGSHL